MGNAQPPRIGHAEGPQVTVSLVEPTDLEKRLPAAPSLRPHRPTRIQRYYLRFKKNIGHIVGPEEVTKPNGSTVLWNVLGLIMILAFGCIAVAFPLRPLLITSGILAFIIFFSVFVLTAIDLRSSSMLELLR